MKSGSWNREGILACLQAAEGQPQLAQGDWADLGTGSGALAVGLASRLKGLTKVIRLTLQIRLLVSLQNFAKEALKEKMNTK